MRFPRKISKRSVAAGLMIVAVAMSLAGRRLADPLRGAAQFAMAPLGHPLTYLADSVKTRVAEVGVQSLSPAEVKRIQDENRFLRAEREQLAQALVASREQLATVQELRKALYGQSHDFPCELVPSRVVTAGSLPYSRTRVITAGAGAAAVGARVTTRELITDRSKSLPPNLAVITSQALVGRIVEAGQYTAVLQLVTDGRFEMWGCIVRDPRQPREIVDEKGRRVPLPSVSKRIDVYVRGDGVDELVAREVSVSHNIMVGDWLRTRRDDAFLPEDVHVGTVVEITKDLEHPGMVALHIRPAAAVESLCDLYIVVPPSLHPAAGGGGG